MKPPQTRINPAATPAEARRTAAQAEALRANLARRKAQARAKTTPQAPEKDQKCR